MKKGGLPNFQNVLKPLSMCMQFELLLTRRFFSGGSTGRLLSADCKICWGCSYRYTMHGFTYAEGYPIPRKQFLPHILDSMKVESICHSPIDSDRDPERGPRYFWKQFWCDFWGYSSENMGSDQLGQLSQSNNQARNYLSIQRIALSRGRTWLCLFDW